MRKILTLFLAAASIHAMASGYIEFEVNHNYIIAKTEDQYHEYFVKKDLKSNKLFGCIRCKLVSWQLQEGLGGCYPTTTLKFPPTGKYYEIEPDVLWPAGQMLVEAIDKYSS